MSTGHDFVAARYGQRADAYLQSAVHAGGADLEALEEWLRSRDLGRVLDLGCGGGHVTYLAARHAREVVACDIAAGMLETVAAEAARRGLINVIVREGAAERLPFDNFSFDAVLSRFSAHHWLDLGAGLREASRVLSAGGDAVLIDTIAPDDAVLDTHLQAVELLRDASHVRNYRVAEWTAAFASAGLDVHAVTRHRLRLDFAGWTGRTRTTEAHRAAIRSVQVEAPTRVREHFAIGPDGSFTIDTCTFRVRCDHADGLGS